MPRLWGRSMPKHLRNRVDDCNWNRRLRGKRFARWNPTDMSENQGFQRFVSSLKHCRLPWSGGVLGCATHLNIIMLAPLFLIDWRRPVMWLALEMQVRENDTVDQNKSRSTEKALLSGNILKSKANQIYAIWIWYEGEKNQGWLQSVRPDQLEA